MRVLIACEFSGVVRNEFARMGHYSVSCDFKESLTSGNHYQGDVRDILSDDWDLMIAHPPCIYLAVSGARWFYHPDDSHLPKSERRPHPKYPDRLENQEEAVKFFMTLANAPINKICIENPVTIMSTRWRKPDQIIHPYEFGHPVSKRTCLWLKNLPLLEPTEIVEPEYVTFSSGRKMSKFHNKTKHKDKEKTRVERSITFSGIAKAMSEQWG